METILRYIIIAAVGALASILANQSIAVFNDGLRPVIFKLEATDEESQIDYEPIKE